MPDPTGRISHLPDMHRGVAWKEPCRVATTGSVTIATALNAGDSIDGVTLATGDRVLVWQQGTGSQNGIYVAGATPVRAFDMDQDATTSVPASEVLGAFVYVITGDTYAGKVFYVTNETVPVIGTNAIDFAEFTPGGTTVDVPFDHGSMGATETVDLADGDWHRGTLTADCAITVQGFTVDQAVVMVFEVAQDGTGGWAITWDADVDFGGSDDQPDQAASVTTVYILASSAGDSTIYGSRMGGMPAAATTVTDETTWGISPAVGTDIEYARQDHTHGTPADPGGGGAGELLISDTPSTPLVFADILQNDAGTDLLYEDA